MPGQHYVSTVVDAAISAGAGRVITPENMNYVHVGGSFILDGRRDPNTGLGTGEMIAPTAVTATTYTADIAHDHAPGSPMNNNPAIPSTMWGT